MARGRYVECAFFIPVCRDAHLSDGQPHDPIALEWLRDQLWDHFGGGTVAPGLYEGFYTDPDTGERVSDQSHKYVIAIDRRHLKHLRRFLMDCCRVFEQKVLYLSIGGDVEFIKHPKSSGK